MRAEARVEEKANNYKLRIEFFDDDGEIIAAHGCWLDTRQDAERELTKATRALDDLGIHRRDAIIRVPLD